MALATQLYTWAKYWKCDESIFCFHQRKCYWQHFCHFWTLCHLKINLLCLNRCQFHQYLTSTFFVWKRFSQLFCAYSLGTLFFGVWKKFRLKKEGQILLRICWPINTHGLLICGQWDYSFLIQSEITWCPHTSIELEILLIQCLNIFEILFDFNCNVLARHSQAHLSV